MTVSLDDDIIRHGLLIAAEEAAITVVRAAHSQFIVEGSDAGTAILTRDGELVAQAAATSMLHSGGMVESLGRSGGLRYRGDGRWRRLHRQRHLPGWGSRQ